MAFIPAWPGAHWGYPIGSYSRVQFRDGVSFGAHWGKCGAWAKNRGRLCQAPGTGKGGRCKWHGGMSTGRPRKVKV